MFNHRINLFIDCGSELSIISDQCWRRLQPDEELETCNIAACFVTQQPFKILGSAIAKIELRDTNGRKPIFSTEHTFCVVAGLSLDILLGVDFL